MECNTSRHILALDIACLELRSKKLDMEYVTEDIAQPSDLMIQQYPLFIAILVNNAFKRIAIDLFLII